MSNKNNNNTAYVWAGQGRSTHHIEHIINFALLWARTAIAGRYPLLGRCIVDGDDDGRVQGWPTRTKSERSYFISAIKGVNTSGGLLPGQYRDQRWRKRPQSGTKLDDGVLLGRLVGLWWWRPQRAVNDNWMGLRFCLLANCDCFTYIWGERAGQQQKPEINIKLF